MKALLLAVVALLLPASLRADDHPAAVKEVEAALKVLNEAFTTRDADKIRTLMADDHQAITPWGGTQTRGDQVKTLAELKLTKYETGPMTFTAVGPDAVLIGYTLTTAGTYRGTPLPERNYASALWVRRGGKWVERHYQETPLPAK